MVSGVNINCYWLATYVFDLCKYFLICVATMLVFLAYGAQGALRHSEQGAR